MRRTCFLVVALGLWGCSSDDRGSALAASLELTVETFNVALAAELVAFESQRRLPIAQAIAQSPADIVCLQEVWRQSDKELIVSASQGSFPYAVFFQHDLDTVVDDPADQHGNTPPAPQEPPCTGEPAARFEALIGCLVQHCSTEPGRELGRVTSSQCIEQRCLPIAAQLLASSARCYGCASASLPGARLSDVREQCTTDPDAGLAFGGQSGVMVLSKHPVENASDWVLPGTWSRRAVVMATVRLPGGVALDVYCNHLTAVFTRAELPYTGAYGDGLTGAQAWAAEQLLQAQKLVALVQRRSGDSRALILGDMNASHAGKGGIEAESEATLETLEAAFEPAVASSYQPQCTYCPDNLLADETAAPVWIDHLLLAGMSAADVTFTERLHVDPVVQVSDELGRATSVPLSDHYGLRTVVRVQP